MDALLKTLADASMEATAAGEAIDEGAFHAAAAHIDAADEHLALLRAQWPTMAATQRTVVARPAATIRTSLDSARARLPKTTALSIGTPENDPDEESEPAD